MTDLISSYQKATNYDSQLQLDREVTVLTTCFAKQIEAQAKAMASQSLLPVERRAYSKLTGHAPQQPQGCNGTENRDDPRKVNQRRIEQTAVHHRDAQEPRKLVTRRDNDVVHIIDAGTTKGVHHLDAPKSEYSKVVRDEENDVACHLKLLSEMAHRKDEHRIEKLKDLILEQGEGAVHAVNESVHRNVRYLVPDQLSDVAHRLEPSRETAHRTDERRVEILENLVVERGKSVE
jgi:hypothetical protein